MTAEQINELLKPRYKVIATYPGCPYHEGDLIEFAPSGTVFKGIETKDSEHWVLTSALQTWCANFKKLEWWEDRKESEMPKYLKQTGMVDCADNPIPDWYLKVKKHFNAGNGEWRDDSYKIFCIEPDGRTIGTNMNYSGFEPATEQEYLTQKQNS